MLMMRIAVLSVAVLLTACGQSKLQAAMVFGNHVNAEVKSFAVGTSSAGWVAGGIKFDTQSSDRIYLLNNRHYNTLRGVHEVSLSLEANVGRLALGDPTAGAAVDDQDYPSSIIVNASGDLYVGYHGEGSSLPSAIWSVQSPLSSPIETQILGNYGAAGDDDPASLAFVPAGFGGGFTAGEDIIIFDEGFDDGLNEAVSVLDVSASTLATPVSTVLYSDNTTGPDIGTNIRGDVSSQDGFAYFIRDTVPTDTIASSTLPFINRVNGEGDNDRVFLDDVNGDGFSGDHYRAFTINPADGSAWFQLRNGAGVKEFWRVDLMGMTEVTPDNFLAAATLEIALDGADGYDVGSNGMTISADGQFLATVAPGGTDRLRVYSLVTVPEPSTIALLGLAGIVGLAVRRHRA